MNKLLHPLLCMAIIFVTAGFTCHTQKATTAEVEQVQLQKILSEKDFNTLFPHRDTFYTYQAFIKAAKELAGIKVKIVKRAYNALQITRIDKVTGKATVVREDEGFDEDWARSKPDSIYYIDYGLFCNGKDVAINKRELAAFFAHVAHETRHGQNGKYDDGLMLRHEATDLPYVIANEEYPAVPGVKYYGRGPLQLSYNGNYGYASHCIFGTRDSLLRHPELLETDAVTSFKSAIYFWMTPQSPKPSAHDAMTGNWKPSAADQVKGRIPGFGSTVNIINGALECGKGDAMENMQDRINFYKHFLAQLHVNDPNCACSCGSMVAYAY